MSGGAPGSRSAVGHCPRCGFEMPGPTEEDYFLAGTAMGGAWDESVGGLTTGYFCATRCAACGALLDGVEYQMYVPGHLGPVTQMVWTD